jgi:8-oxo-dGTP diphosphatase
MKAGSRLIVVGVNKSDEQVARFGLAHGQDPTALLAEQGWNVLRVREVKRHLVDPYALTMTFIVEQSLDSAQAVDALAAHPGGSDDLETFEGEGATCHQRVAAYAVVTSSRGVLMTQFSDRTGAPGQWGLPGGGLEADEGPDHAVVREVWEESGQLIELGELALVRTSRWVGRAPTGRLEDFHAVRVIYRALCPEPTDPIVHDVGGTTASAAWLTSSDLELLALTPGWRSILREVARAGVSEIVMAPEQTDGPDQHHHEADTDDRARPHA